jgi:diadenosine tetraphosphatase ApaH/serine/threonine PP2A family protein phosphatase
MRRAVIADIHGNNQALAAVLVDIEDQTVDEIISLGDTVGYGPEPERVVRTLIAVGIPSALGNHELALINDDYFRLLNPTCRQSLARTRELLSEESLAWLAALPVVIFRDNARFLHGCPPASTTEYLFDPSPSRLKRIFAGYPEAICFVGHTHLLSMFKITAAGTTLSATIGPGTTTIDPACRYLFTCGSVGQPRDDHSNLAKYGIWDDERHTVEIRAVPYDVDTTVRLIKVKGFPDINARRLLWS